MPIARETRCVHGADAGGHRRHRGTPPGVAITRRGLRARRMAGLLAHGSSAACRPSQGRTPSGVWQAALRLQLRGQPRPWGEPRTAFPFHPPCGRTIRALGMTRRTGCQSIRKSRLSGGLALGRTPPDVHRIARHFISQDVRPHGHEFADRGIAAAPTTLGEHHQTVIGERQRAGDFARRDRVFIGDMADQPKDIGAGRSPPDHSHNRRSSGA